MQKIEIRTATVDDAEDILKIYAPYVTDTAITFEYVVPSIDEFKNRIAGIIKKYPYIVAVIDGNIAGYAYAAAFKERAAYDWSVETTVYVDKSRKKSGIGKALYDELEKRLKKLNITNMYACIAYLEQEDEYLTKNSVQFHEHAGFKLAGEYHKCANKFGRWYNMVWMEKIIGEHTDNPLPVKIINKVV